MPFAEAGSQRWLQVAINRRPDVLIGALCRAGAVSDSNAIHWSSPLESEGCCEYRDNVALRKAGIPELRLRSLATFWPQRGPVWDALGQTSDGRGVFVEAKAHIPEASSLECKASPASLKLIQKSLAEARRTYAPRATADWSRTFYQYANRLAHQYLIHEVNRLPSLLVFLYFINAPGMNGPSSECEWRGAIRLLHATLGLPASLEKCDVFDAFVDVRELQNAV